MRRVLSYALMGYLFVLLQTAAWPHLLSFSVKPDLVLVLVVYLGLSEPPLRGGLLAIFLGSCLDAVSGSHPGLNALLLLLVFFAVRMASARFNTENSLLMLFMVACGTLLHSCLLLLFASFADAGSLVWQVLTLLVPQEIFNLLAAWLLLKLAPRLQQRIAPRSELPGLRRLDQRYGA